VSHELIGQKVVIMTIKGTRLSGTLVSYREDKGKLYLGEMNVLNKDGSVRARENRYDRKRVKHHGGRWFKLSSVESIERIRHDVAQSTH